MKYVITDGQNYIAQLKTGITVVSNISAAQKYEAIKANNVLKSLPKHLKKYNWEVREETVGVKESKVINNSKYDGLTDNILEKMLDWEQYIIDLKSYIKVLDSQLLTVQAEIQDIEHAAEFFDFDMYKGWKLYKMLQDARKRRRTLKDEKKKIDYILKSNFKDCTQNAISKYIESMDERTYLPRIYQELFN